MKKFKSNKYTDQVEIAANKIHAAKQIFKEIWPRKEMDNLINLRRVPEDLVIKRPYATSQNWTDKMYISEYRNVRFFHKLDGLKLNSEALFQQFNRISRILADGAAQRFSDAKRRKEEEDLREAEPSTKRQRSVGTNIGGGQCKGMSEDNAKKMEEKPRPKPHEDKEQEKEAEEDNSFFNSFFNFISWFFFFDNKLN